MAKSADHDGRKIVDYLKRCAGRSAVFHDIVSHTSISKQILPKILRDLSQKGFVERSETQTGNWTLCDRSTRKQAFAARDSHGFRPKGVPSSSNTNNRLEEQILQQLSLGPKTAKVVAQNIGLTSKKSVNPTLYKLEEQKLVKVDKAPSKKPVWSLSGKAADMNDFFRDSAQDKTAPGAYGPHKNMQPLIHGGWQQPLLHGGWQQPFVQSGWQQPFVQGSGHHRQALLHNAGSYGNAAPETESGWHNHRGQQHTFFGKGSGPYQSKRNYDQDKYSGSYPLTNQPRFRGRGRPRQRAGFLRCGQSRENSPQKGTMAAAKITGDSPSSFRESDSPTTTTSDGDNPSQVSMESDQASAVPNTSAADPSRNDNAGMKEEDDNAGMEEEDEDFEEDDDYSGSEYESHRFFDMGLDNQMFSDMTYVDEEDEETEERDVSLEDIIIIRIGLEKSQSISSSRLAEALSKTEDEVIYALRRIEDKVTVNDTNLSLTQRGKELVKAKLEAFPGLAEQLLKAHQEGDQSVTGNPASAHVSGNPASLHLARHQPLFLSTSLSNNSVLLAQPLNGPQSFHQCPPPSPMQLIQNDPAFSAGGQGGSWAASSTHSTSAAAVVGRGLNRGGGWEDNSFGKNPLVSGAYDVRDLEVLTSRASTPPKAPPPQAATTSKSFFAPPPAPQPASTQSSSQSREMNMFRDDHIPWNTFSLPTKLSSSTITSDQQSMLQTTAASVDWSSHRATNLSLPAAFGLHSINPALHKYTHEGLTVCPVSSKEKSVVGILPFHNLTPMEIIEREMGRTELISADRSLKQDATSSRICSDSLGMHRSKSLPSMGENSGSMLQITSESFAALNKNPISALMEYAQSRHMQAIIEVVNQRGPSHRPVFVMAAKVGNRLFPGVTCHNKKDGRKEAADVALRTLIAEGQYSTAMTMPAVSIAPDDMTHFDKVAALTHQTFNTLIATIPENLAGRKVIAGLVMKRSNDDVGIVVSIGTGNRCITGDQLSLEGNTVNDSHAEIITRRGFMRFLYQQLELYRDGQPHDLFEPGTSGKLRVKNGITFHLYISTAPCGDGALFSPRDMESNVGKLVDMDRRDHHPTFTSNVQGLLRTKMEGGEGTIPVETKDLTIQTWDGVVRGERLRTMSCTDKICRWNVLGLQGALLSHFLEPIYLDSLTLGFLFDHGHLSRAVCCRLNREEPHLNDLLPSLFHLNHPWLGRVTACQPLRETQKTKAYSINWMIGDQKPEVLDGTMGHCYTAVEKQLFSRLAKRSLYDSFKQVARHLGRADLAAAPSYLHSKMAARDFQAAKTTLLKKFQQLGCGWVKKPVEEEMFS